MMRLGWLVLLTACLAEGVAMAQESSYPVAAKLASLLTRPPAPITPTGLTRKDYLDAMEPLVRMAAGWVDADGAVLDPRTGKEWGQTSPRFASSAAILRHFGRVEDLHETVLRVMDHACARLPDPASKRGSPDFWMRELMTAYHCLRPLVPAPRAEAWRAALSRVDPERHYQVVDPKRERLGELNNWAVYAAGGESMRQQLGIGGGDGLWGNGFFDVYMEPQLIHLTPEGMYRDPGDPITYDITTRLQLANALYWGYRGPLFERLNESLRRGALTQLLFVSPRGFVPYGGRSGAFQFREAIIAALGELEARRYRDAGDLAMAGRFKRQARLALSSILPWLRGTPIQHIKNRFPPETLHGCDSYGQYSVYTLFCASVLGLAALYDEDDGIAEVQTPAEQGGYALTLSPPFHKVFAACRGHYAEIDTAADARYDATGLGRILLDGVPFGLLPAEAFAAAGTELKYTLAPGTRAPERPLAIGPAWDGGTLAETPEDKPEYQPVVTIEKETSDEVVWSIRWPRVDGGIVQRFVLDAAGLKVNCARDAGRPFRYEMPLLATDGETPSAWRLDNNTIIGPGGVTIKTDAGKWTWQTGEFANRNGLYRVATTLADKGALTVHFRSPTTK